jgi:hypothetical protein
MITKLINGTVMCSLEISECLDTWNYLNIWWSKYENITFLKNHTNIKEWIKKPNKCVYQPVLNTTEYYVEIISKEKLIKNSVSIISHN